MFEIVKKAIDELNVNSLLPDSPSDEFDIESRKIAGRIRSNSTVEDIAQVICDVFSKSFDEDYKVRDFLITARKIYESLKMNNS